MNQRDGPRSSPIGHLTALVQPSVMEPHSLPVKLHVANERRFLRNACIGVGSHNWINAPLPCACSPQLPPSAAGSFFFFLLLFFLLLSFLSFSLSTLNWLENRLLRSQLRTKGQSEQTFALIWEQLSLSEDVSERVFQECVYRHAQWR